MDSGGRRRAEPAATGPRPILVLTGYAGLVVFALLTWYGLVRAAIYFGQQARGGTGISWLLLGLAGAGAVACLAFVLAVAARLARLFGLGTRSRHHR